MDNQKQREEFEAWLAKDVTAKHDIDYLVERSMNLKHYSDIRVDAQWEAWQHLTTHYEAKLKEHVRDYGLLEISYNHKKVLLESCETALREREAKLVEAEKVSVERLRDNVKYLLDINECEDTIAALEARVAELSGDKWISVEDRLPEYRVNVLISNGENVGHARLTANKHFKIVASNDPVSFHKVTHWQPLPAPPLTQPQSNGDKQK